MLHAAFPDDDGDAQHCGAFSAYLGGYLVPVGGVRESDSDNRRFTTGRREAGRHGNLMFVIIHLPASTNCRFIS